MTDDLLDCALDLVPRAESPVNGSVGEQDVVGANGDSTGVPAGRSRNGTDKRGPAFEFEHAGTGRRGVVGDAGEEDIAEVFPCVRGTGECGRSSTGRRAECLGRRCGRPRRENSREPRASASAGL